MNLKKVNPENSEIILQSLRDFGYTAGMVLLYSEWRFHEMLRWIENANQIVTDHIAHDIEEDGETLTPVNLRPYVGVFADVDALDDLQKELISNAGGVCHDQGADPTSPENLLENVASACLKEGCCKLALQTSEVHSVTDDPTSAVSHIVNPTFEPKHVVRERTTDSTTDENSADMFADHEKHSALSTDGYGG